MPTTAWSVLRDDISLELGRIDFATTTNIAADNSIISTGLRARFNSDDDPLVGRYVLIESGNNAGVVRKITAYTASTGTLTVAGVALASESAAVNCSIYIVHPADLQLYFNRARQDVFPDLCLVRDLRTLVTGQRQAFYTLPSTLRGRPLRVYLGRRDPVADIAENLFTDPGFEDWASATSLNKWTLAGTGATVNREQETTTPRNYAVLQGTYSARVAVPSTTVTTLLQTVTPDQATEGMELNVYAWVYTNVASRVSVRIGSSDGTSHTGTGWELIHQTANLGATATDFSSGVVASSGAAMAFFVDEAFAILGQSERASLDWEELLRWSWIPPAAGASDNGFLQFHEALPEKHRLRIIGRDLLSSVSADTDTIEIDGELLEPLYDRTRELAAHALAIDAPEDLRGFWRERAADFGARWKAAVNNGTRVSLPAPALRLPY